MSMKQYRIREFGGIDQSMEQSAIDEGSSPDACNMDTRDGNLSVAKGFVKHLLEPVPGDGPVKRVYLWRSLVTTRYVVVAGAGQEQQNAVAALNGSVLTLQNDIDEAAREALLDQPFLECQHAAV